MAKDQYVRLNTGVVFRSLRVLPRGGAAGHHAGDRLHGFLRRQGGLFAFRTLEEIAEAVREINADYAMHSQAAYEIAAEYFEATTVLARCWKARGSSEWPRIRPP